MGNFPSASKSDATKTDPPYYSFLFSMTNWQWTYTRHNQLKQALFSASFWNGAGASRGFARLPRSPGTSRGFSALNATTTLEGWQTGKGGKGTPATDFQSREPRRLPRLPLCLCKHLGLSLASAQ
ncbi:hypothetical protein J3459_007725 [Metarhizium acridum]|nr:hypothetical protein J3459_007725 [Metarhizium acridum]